MGYGSAPGDLLTAELSGPTSGYRWALALVGRGARARLAAVILKAGAGMASVSLLVRLLGTPRYGILASVLAAVSLVVGLVSSSLATTTTRAIGVLAGNSVEPSGPSSGVVALASLITSSVIGLVGAGIVGGFIWFDWFETGSASRLMLVLGLSGFLLGGTTAWAASSIARGMSDVFATELPHVALQIGRLIAVVVVFVWDLSTLSEVAVALGLSVLPGMVISIAFIARQVVKSTGPISRSSLIAAIQGLARDALPVGFLGLGFLLILWADVIVLGLSAPAREVGSYEPILRVTDRLLNLVIPLIGAQFLTTCAALFAQSRYSDLEQLHGSSLKLSYWLFFPAILVLAAFPEHVLQVLYGSEFPVREELVWILLPGYAVQAGVGLSRHILIAAREDSTMYSVSGMSIVITLVLAITLIPPFGAVGAAAATSASFVAVGVAVTASLKQCLGITVWRDRVFMETVASSLVPLLVAVAVRSILFPSEAWQAIAWAGLLWLAWCGYLLGRGLISKEELLFLKRTSPPSASRQR